MGANARLQYQNQFIATDADEITTQTANTDEVLLAETTWEEVINGITAEGAVDDADFTPEAYKATVTSTAKGDIVFYDGNNWCHLGGLAQFEGITTANLDQSITAAATIATSGLTANQVIILTAAFTVQAANNADGNANLDGVKGDIFQATSGTEVSRRGNLTDLSGIPAIDDVVAGNTLPGTPDQNDVVVFSAAVASGLDIKGKATQKFHPVQPLIIESSLRGGGENIPLPYKTGNSAMTKDAPGPISVEEGMVFAGTGHGMEMFYSMMTQDRMPDRQDVDGTSYTTPTEETVGTNYSLSSGTTLVDGAEVTFPTTSLTKLDVLEDGITDTASNPRRIPVRLDIDPSAAPGAGNVGLVKIEGRDKDNLPISEFLAWTGTEDVSKKTKNYYIDIDKYQSSGWPSSGSPNFTIKYTDTAQKIVYTPQDEELVRFWFVRLVTGITPRLFSGVIGNSFEVALGRDTALEWTVSCLGKRSWPNRNLRGEEWNSGSGTIDNDNRRGRKVLIDDSIGFAPAEIFTGWQCELDIGGTRMAIIDTTLSINQNLENSGVITGDRYEESQPFRGTDREVMCDGTIVFSPENNLSQVYLDNTTLENVQLNLRNRPRGGFYWLTRFVFPTTQINTNPDPASPRDGRISQTFNLKCFTEGIGGGPKDYYIETFVPEYTPVRDFTE